MTRTVSKDLFDPFRPPTTDEIKDALKKINHAIDLTDKNERSYPNILDTKAEVLWRMDLFDEAIKIIEEAILIDPESEYYKDQRLKFQNSKEGV